MGWKDLPHRALWLGVAAVALSLATATTATTAAAPPEGDFTVTPDPPNQGEAATFTCDPCPGSTSVTWDFDDNGAYETADGP